MPRPVKETPHQTAARIAQQIINASFQAKELEADVISGCLTVVLTIVQQTDDLILPRTAHDAVLTLLAACEQRIQRDQECPTGTLRH